MSLEVLAYIAVAGIPLIYSVSAISSYRASVNQSLNYYSYSSFASAINTAVLGRYDYVYLQVPHGICGIKVNGSSFSIGYWTFYLAETVRINGSLLCSAGMAGASIYYGTGNVSIV